METVFLIVYILVIIVFAFDLSSMKTKNAAAVVREYIEVFMACLGGTYILEKDIIVSEMQRKAFWDHITGAGNKSPWKYLIDEIADILDTAFLAWLGIVILSGIIYKVASFIKGVKGELKEETVSPKSKTSLSITGNECVQYIDAKGNKHFACPARKGETLSIEGEEIITVAQDGSFRIFTLKDLFPDLFKEIKR